MKNSWQLMINSCSPTQWILQLAANKVIFIEFTLILGVIVGVILFEKSFQRRVLHL